MADTAYQIQYRNEFIHGFEDRQSILRSTCVQEAVINGNRAVFLVADSGSAVAVNRGVQGLITARADNLTQTTATLQEWHDLVRRTNFNIFASQGDARRIMQETTMAVVNRKMDDLIIAQLDTATNDTSTAAPASLDLVIKAQVILGNNFVDLSDEDNLFMLVTPAFHGYMMQQTEYASADYVEVKPFTGPVRRFRRWGGFNWMTHPRLTNSVGAGGSGTSEQCYAYHRNALGCAVDKSGIDSPVGYDVEQGYSFARVSVHMGVALLQNSGVVQILHNGSAYVAT